MRAMLLLRCTALGVLAASSFPSATGSGGGVPKVCNVLSAEFGAVGDNATEDTAAVRHAISACGGHGGTVLLPAGHTFLLRPIELPSSTTLVVDGDIAGWRDIETWPNSTSKRCPVTPYQTPRAHVRTVPQKEDLIWSANASGVTISGTGTIDGAGWQWWPKMHGPPPPGAPSYWHSCRPSLVAFGRRSPAYDSGVSDVRVEGVTLKDSPFWTFSGRGLLRAVISHVHVTTSGCGYGEAPNTDGFNVQGEDILIEHCSVRNGDDCVPIFPPTRNVTVRNITCECGNGLVPCIWPSMSIPGEGDNPSRPSARVSPPACWNCQLSLWHLCRLELTERVILSTQVRVGTSRTSCLTVPGSLARIRLS